MKILQDKEFWYNFFRNPLCLSGCILVFSMTLAILIIPSILGIKPTDQKPWNKYKGPGYKSPICFAENYFEVNKKPNIPERLLNENALQYEVSIKEYKNFRITLKSNGKVNRLKEGNSSIREINSKDFKEVYQVLKDQTKIKIEKEFLIQSNKTIENVFTDLDQKVIILEGYTDISKDKIDIIISNQKVASIKSHKNGELSNIKISGPDIVALNSNGKLLQQTNYLGTDELGRDLLTRILYGGRISLMIGVVATFVSLIIGVLYGAISGYYGGKTDRIMMSSVDILYAIPFMFLVIILMVSFGKNLILLFIALGAVQWLTMARIVRGQILSLKEMEYIEAARMCGATNLQIIIKHLIPHTIGPVIVYTSLTVPVVILEESFLAFIGLQVQFGGESLDSWGTLINQGIFALGENGERMWVLLYPALAMALTLFGLNGLGDGLRDLLDPKMKKRKAA